MPVHEVHSEIVTPLTVSIMRTRASMHSYHHDYLDYEAMTIIDGSQALRLIIHFFLYIHTIGICCNSNSHLRCIFWYLEILLWLILSQDGPC